MKIKAAVLPIALILVTLGIIDPSYPVEVSLYLVPQYRMMGDTLEIRDIARIEVKDIDRGTVGSTCIDGTLFKDGYIDRREILVMMREKFGNTVQVFGGGVAIVGNPDKNEKDTALSVAVKKGDKVRFSLVRGPVSVEVAGTAMGNGIEGEVIPVKLSTEKVVHGRIAAAGRVEAGL